ncbi:MAG: hypothetical protein HOO88_08665 [Kiritimatiellaceae bacterium]|nr:hypothetical protein [Kiritimatiellaceae bacterium]
MKKRAVLISVLLGVAGLAGAAVLNEWNFYSDPSGRTLSQAVNSKSAAVFSAGGTGFLETDGRGALVGAYEDAGSSGMWTNGAILNAALGSAVSDGVRYLRFDFSYDLSSTNNNSGAVLGFALRDSTGGQVAGVALRYDTGSGAVPAYTATELTALTNTAGTVAVVAKIDLTGQTLNVWYSLAGDVSGFSEGSPHYSTAVTLNTFDSLRFHATGDMRPAGSTDQVAANLLRTADSWADILSAEPQVPAGKYRNEWTFERDISGRALSEAINSGTNSPLAQFAAGSGSTVFTTNRALLCTGEDAGTGGVWTNGALLDAALPSSTSGVHYLRYDVAYSLTNSANNSGTVLGVYFSGDSGTKVAGLVLGYDTGNLESAKPAGYALMPVPGAQDLSLSGTLSAVAEVDLDSDTLKVWYDLSGSNTFTQGSPAFTTNITLTAMDHLRFHATGDFRPAGSTDYAAVDNIRHSASWAEVTEPPANLAASPVLSLGVSDSLGGAMDIGQTNLVTVVITNSGGAATHVTSVLTHDGAGSAFTVTSNNAAVALGGGAVLTNTYEVIALQGGRYVFTATGISDQTNSAPAQLRLAVGVNLSFLAPGITEVSGGVIPGYYEPGETLNITISTTNDGARSVSNIVNTLSAGSSGFTVTPASASYASLVPGALTSTVYQVLISPAVTAGSYTFFVTNRSGSLSWTDSFSLDVFSGGIPGVSATALTIRVAAGSTASAAVMLTNAGNAGLSFNVTDDGRLPAGNYTVTTQAADRLGFVPAQFSPDSLFTNWSGNLTASSAIGFTMPLGGNLYTAFFVNRTGMLTLTSTNGASATLMPFHSAAALNTNSIRFVRSTNRLAVAWGNATGQEFQAWINADGTVQYLYQYGSWGSADIRIQDQVISHTPGLTATDAIRLTPSFWVSYTPSNGLVNPASAQALSFTANAQGQAPGTNRFNTTVNWNTGTSNTIAVTVIVEAVAPRLAIVSPQPFNFSGAAGFITHTNLVLTNSGNVALSYTVTDSGLQLSGYSWTNTVHGWQHIPAVSGSILSPSDFGTRVLDIGFPFVYFGRVCTSLTAQAGGVLTLGSGQTIRPFGANLSVDANASVRFFTDASSRMIITWENMAQSGGGADQTFQAVLERSGAIRFNYQTLGSGWSNGVIRLSDTSGTVSGTLINSATTVTNITVTPVYSNQVTTIGSITFTNQIKTGETVTTNITYTATANNQSLVFTPGAQRIISASPSTGTLLTGQTADILITGDARSLSGGGANDVTNSTTLTFSYSGKTTNAPIRFTATNSVEAAYAASAESMWGAEPVFTSRQNSDGSRTIEWFGADDGLSRTYTVWYTTNLMGVWEMLYRADNVYSFTDSIHAGVPVIYYKVSVE